MNRITLAFLFCLTSPIVNAQAFRSQIIVICDQIENITAVIESYEEKPVFVGDALDSKTKVVITLNEKTGTWSFIQSDGKTACILGAGHKGKQLIKGLTI